MSPPRWKPLAPAACALLLAALVASVARADLEVSLPPGTPGDWFSALTARVPAARFVQVEKKEKDPKAKKPESSGKTVEKEKEHVSTEVRPQLHLGGGSTQAILHMGVIVADLPFHTPWVKRPPKERPVAGVYPPLITDDLFWQAQAGFLRRLLHPAFVPESEMHWYLVALGECARSAAEQAKAEKFLDPLTKSVEEALPPLPKDAPEAPPGDDEAEPKMLRHLARDDLADGDPYSLDPGYASRLLSLGASGFPALKACAESKHALLRRNATALLGYYDSPEVPELLRKLFRDDADACVRTRALVHLVRRKDKEIVADLVKALASSDRRLAPLAAHALGAIGHQDGVAPLVAALDKDPDDWELIVACTIALARAGGANEKEKANVNTALGKLEESLRKSKPRFVDSGEAKRPTADVPDHPADKNRMLLELATIALARLGDKAGAAKLEQLIAGKWEDQVGNNPVGGANAGGPQRAFQCDALKWVCSSSWEVLIETWGVLPGNSARLRQVLEHRKTYESLRVLALRIDAAKPDKRYLAQVALESESVTLRSLATRLLVNADEKLGLKVAESVFQTYLSGKPMSATNPKGDVQLLTALEILYHAKKLKVSMFKPAIARAMSEWVCERPEVSPEGMKPFRLTPPILDVLCWMLGSTGDKEAVPILRRVGIEKTLPARAEAVLQIGQVPGDASVAALVEFLNDDDGWVRYYAYLALKIVTSEDHFADWIYGSKEDRAAATAKYRALVKKGK